MNNEDLRQVVDANSKTTSQELAEMFRFSNSFVVLPVTEMDLVGSDHCEDQNPDVDISTSSNRMSEPAEIIIEYEHTFTSTDAKIGHSTPKRKRNESMSAAVRDGGLKRLTSPQSDNCDVLSISSTTVTASECNISNNSDTVLARNDSSITLSASSLSATVTASSDDEPRELPSISGKMTRHRQIMQQRSKMHKHVWNISGKTVGSAEKTIASLKKKIKNLQQQNRRLKSKVYSQQSLMEYLRETCGLTPNAGLVLNVGISCMLLHTSISLELIVSILV
ncbi:unnamed protein product [Acanthoscelides obtectus]|uniref:Uncharacterized protein n=1 Tax=Acanthoscelides obtectus TaxID=200917 RepID=A0A9P0JXX8_ACAOB|nr:unnamed protein product [Acanthoscelides obtectus]CAK1625407.1 hypothetical protein AOBTE_LOCUS3144 [Acanthoscelides obtectus]